tara:strand:+ start:158 stop:1315 length:1158 start_codon:yes stop_codon:yes gene_type:complete
MALTKISRSLLDTGVSDSSDATAITIDSSERVGIGTSSPASNLHISTTTEARLIIEGDSDNDSGEESALIEFKTDGGAVRHMVEATGSSGNNLKLVAGSANTSNTVNSEIIFETKTSGSSAAERMRIDSSGNVGIGTTSPDTELTIVGGLKVSQSALTDSITMSVNTSSSYAQTITLDDVGLSFDNNSSSRGYKFSNNNGTERMQIDASGRIVAAGGFCAENGITVIGQSERTHFQAVDSEASTAPRWRPSVDNVADLGDSSLRWDDVRATNGTIVTSDRNEKNTITDSDLGLDFVKRLSPKSYKFNGKTRTHYGLIAQDIETVLSDISKSTTDFAGFIKDDISEEQDGSELRYGLRYTEFVSPLIKAIQELSAKIEELESKIDG